MNFFGHATVATWSNDEPGFVLGAMLPDFASMVRSPIAEIEHPDLSAGIALHHTTDEAFHGASTFLRLCKASVAELEAVGVARGSSRAIAHVGVELFLDGWLVRHGSAAGAYMAAIAAAKKSRLGRAIAWRRPEAEERFDRLRDRLEAYGTPGDLDRIENVAERLLAALAGRPRLRLDDRGAEQLRAHLPVMRARVLAEAQTLLAEVRSRMPQVAGHSKVPPFVVSP